MDIKSAPEHRWVNRESLAWLLFAQAVAILPLFLNLPLWIPLLWLVALTWRVQIYRGAWAFPSNFIKAVLGSLSIVALLITYSGAFSVEPLVGFLVISFVLKLVEVKSRGDVLVVIYVGFIAVAAQFLFFQTVFIAIYGLISTVALLSAWNCVYRTRGVSIKRQWWFSLSLVAQSVPLMLLLFLILPRLGNLWHVPIPKSTGTTGFGETMSPGDFSNLSRSREVAFRVSFEGNRADVELPNRNQWYWRGLVLNEFDGRTWKNDEGFGAFRAASGDNVPDFWNLSLKDDANFIRYNVLMEPHQQRWLFSLMAPVTVRSSMSKVYFAPDFLLKSAQPVANKMQYQVISSPDYLASAVELAPFELRQNTQLPESGNPRTRQLVESWKRENFTQEGIINQALEMYRASFTYTLQPPVLGQNSVDEFLFASQRGFCEHFSSSFVFMMRAAGIPARVVVGYQGGELNAIENYIIVRQQDAHAWAEVWLVNRGWVRVDPTSAVSPSRIEQGLEQSLPDTERDMVNGFFSSNLIAGLQLRMDAFNYSWQRWVLGYDAEKQGGLFKRMLGGQEAWRVAALFLASVASLLFLYFCVLTWRGRRRYEYAEQAILRRWQAKLAKRGFHLRKGETAVEFANRIASEKPEWKRELDEIARLHQQIAYENKSQHLSRFEQAVKNFKADG